MARGITQDQVNAAIDALLVAGERPTIERVRAALGTGSPNTLTRMLDAWWSQLHERLTRQQARMTIPDAPGEVAVAATRLWQLALDHAGAQVGQATAAQRDVLARETAQLASERADWLQRLGHAEAGAADADRARAATEARLADLQRLLEQQAVQLADVKGRWASAEAHGADLTSRLEAARQALLASHTKASGERTALEASHRAAEDRWMQEVDRARRDEAKTSTRLQQVESAAQAAAKDSAIERSASATQQRKLEQELARKDARVSTLADQLDRLHQRMAAALANQRLSASDRRIPGAVTSKRAVKAR